MSGECEKCGNHALKCECDMIVLAERVRILESKVADLIDCHCTYLKKVPNGFLDDPGQIREVFINREE